MSGDIFAEISASYIAWRIGNFVSLIEKEITKTTIFFGLKSTALNSGVQEYTKIIMYIQPGRAWNPGLIPY